MAEKSGFFNAREAEDGTYDREYDAEQFAKYFANFISNGVYANPANQLKVVFEDSPSKPFVVVVRKGKAYIDGYWYELTEDMEITIPVNTKSYAIKDVVCCTLNKTERSVSIILKEDVINDYPTNNNTQHDLVLSTILVQPNASKLNAKDITDKRPDKTYCGFVTGVIDQIDTTELFQQYDDAFQEWFNEMKNQLSTDAAGNLQLQIDDLEQKNDEHEEKITNLETKMSGLLDFFYPVGTIYETENLSFDPNKEWGGSWKRIKGRVLVGVDEEDTDYSMSGKTGGAKTLNLAHSHVVNNHTHGLTGARAGIGRSNENINGISYSNGGNPYGIVFDRFLNTAPGVIGGSWGALDTVPIYGSTDNDSPGTNTQLGNRDIRQPYITCYMWERIG